MLDQTTALRLIRIEYDRLDAITGLDTSGIELRLSNRMTKKLGYFSADKKNIFAKPRLSITVSNKITDSPELFLDVIRHEYAHAAVYLRYPLENHGHDAVWKNTCREVGCIPRATRALPDGFDIPSKSRPVKYIVKCRNCGAESQYKSESKVVKIAEGKLRGRIYCKSCSSNDFSVIIL